MYTIATIPEWVSTAKFNQPQLPEHAHFNFFCIVALKKIFFDSVVMQHFVD